MNGGSGAVLVALVAVVPVVILMMTSFVKLSVVLSLLRNAIGAPDAPSGLIVMGISLVLTFFVMAPVAIDMIDAATTAPSPTQLPSPAPTQTPVPSTTPGSGSAPASGTTPATTPAPTSGFVPTSASAPATGAASVTGTAPTTAPGTTPAADTAATSAAATTAAPVDPYAAAPGAPSASTAAAAPSSGSAEAATTADASGGVAANGAGRTVDVEGAVKKLLPAEYGDDVDAGARALVPLRAFLTKHAAKRDRDSFAGLARDMGRSVSGDEMWVLAPAFLATELREAFAIAVLVFLPFLVIDLVVALGLAALGLQNTQVQSVALPLKLLLFVAVDGWRLLLESLLRGYV